MSHVPIQPQDTSHNITDAFLVIVGPTDVRTIAVRRSGIADCNDDCISKRSTAAVQLPAPSTSGTRGSGLCSAAATMVTAGLEDAAQRLRFLAEASRLLAESIDYEATLKTVARLAVPDIADWCVVDLLQVDGTLARVAIEHRDPVRRELAHRLRQHFPPRSDATSGPANVARTGRTEFEFDIADAVLRQIAPEPERLRLLRRLGLHSYISASLATRDRTLGSITFFTEAPRVFHADDVLMADDLARRAATAIDNARLYEEAKRAVHARDEMFAIVTHDLRAPLSAIMTAAALQLSAVGDDEGGHGRARAETIQRSAQHMNRLIRDLTDLGQIDAGRFAIEPARQDPMALVRHVVAALQPVAARRRSHISANMVEPIPGVVCDGDRVMQVLLNLASNAIKVGALSVTIEVEAVGADVVFTVSDTGPGIAAHDLPFMFDRYWRASAAGYKGTGIGLSISKGIVEAHGGRIWVESQLGIGTQFFFTMPR